VSDSYRPREDEETWDAAYDKIREIKDDLKERGLKFYDEEYDHKRVWGYVCLEKEENNAD
jgi:hypothetical protein